MKYSTPHTIYNTTKDIYTIIHYPVVTKGGSMKRNLLLIFTLIFLTLFSSFASGQVLYQVNELSVESCSCSLLSNPLTLENAEQATQMVHISQRGDAAQYSTLQTNIVVLEPGEQTKLESWINLPCNIEKKLQLTTDIKSTKGTQSLTQTIDVKECANLKVTGANLAQEGCACNSYEYKIVVGNPREYPDEYLIEIEDPQKFVTLSKQSLLLMPKDSAEVFAYIKPDCNFFGVVSSTLKITSIAGQYVSKVPISLQVKDCVDTGEEQENEPLINGRRLLIASLVFWFLVLLVLLVLYLINTDRTKSYYLSVRIKEPRLKRTRKKLSDAEEMPSERREPGQVPRWLLIVLILLAIVLFCFISYKLFSYSVPLVKNAVPQDLALFKFWWTKTKESETGNQTIDVSQTAEENQTTAQDQEQVAERGGEQEQQETTQPSEDNIQQETILSLEHSIKVLYFVALAAAFVFLVVLLFTRKKQVIMVGESNKGLRQLFNSRWIRLTLFALITAAVFTVAYLNRGTLFILWKSIKEFVILYWIYFLVGVVILVILLTLLSRQKNE